MADLRKYFDPFKLVPLTEELPHVDEQNQLNMFSEVNPDVGLFNMVDEETIALGGSELYIYKVVLDEGYDDLYDEEPVKKYGEKVLVRGHYNPVPIGEELSEFGIKLTNDQMFTFNKSYMDATLGRQLKPGDVIQPRFQNLMYEIHEVQEAGFGSNYGVYHYLASAQVRRDLDSLLSEQIDID